MNNNLFSIKHFLIIALIFNLPPLMAVSKIGILFGPVLFWINIPVLWTGIAKAMGETHFKIGEFGAMPQSPTAYAVILSFWLILAAIVTLMTTKLKK